jgi:hypothetical protein
MFHCGKEEEAKEKLVVIRQVKKLEYIQMIMERKRWRW